jgi:protein kinase-like protein/SH3 domain-containing protein
VTGHRDRAGKVVVLGDEIGRGGEGAVFAVAGNPQLCAKIFHPDRARERADKLLAMVERRPGSLPRHAVTWPVELLYRDSGAFAGYLMPTVRGAVELHRYLVPDERAQFAGWLTLRDLHRLAASVAEILAGIHRAGHCVGDLKPQNVLVVPLSGRVTLVDTDSFHLVDRRSAGVHACPVVTPEYTAPELHREGLSRARRTPASDVFALAILVYQLLVGGSHPFEGDGEGRVPDRIPRQLCPIVPGVTGIRAPARAIPFATLHPALRDAFIRCFGPGHAAPEQRPSAAEWRDLLMKSARDMVRCPKSAAHEHPRELARCPWCERRERTGLDLFPTGQRWQRASLARAPDPRAAPEAERVKWLLLHVRGRMVGARVTEAERAWLDKAGAALGFPRARVSAVIQQAATTPVLQPWEKIASRARSLLCLSPDLRGRIPRIVSRARGLLPDWPRQRTIVISAASLLSGSVCVAGVLAAPGILGGAPRGVESNARVCAAGGGRAVIGTLRGRGAFLREAPSTSSGKIGLPEGTAVRLTGQSLVAEELTWSEVLVENSGTTGWVAARYLTSPR